MTAEAQSNPYYEGVLARARAKRWRDAVPYAAGIEREMFIQGFNDTDRDRLARELGYRWRPKPEPEEALRLRK